MDTKTESVFVVLAEELISDAEQVPCSIEDFIEGLSVIIDLLNERKACG